VSEVEEKYQTHTATMMINWVQEMIIARTQRSAKKK